MQVTCQVIDITKEICLVYNAITLTSRFLFNCAGVDRNSQLRKKAYAAFLEKDFPGFSSHINVFLATVDQDIANSPLTSKAPFVPKKRPPYPAKSESSRSSHSSTSSRTSSANQLMSLGSNPSQAHQRPLTTTASPS